MGLWDLVLGVGSAAVGLPGVGNALAGLFTSDEKTKADLGAGIGSVLPAGLNALMTAFGAEDSASADASKKQADVALLKQLMGESAFTATGQMGPAAQAEAQRAAQQYIGKSSAEGLRAAQAQRNIGSQFLGAGQEMMNALTSQTQMNLGNNQRQLREMMQASGGTPAALAAGMSNLGQANRESLAGLFSQGAQAQQQNLAQAGQAFGQSEATRIADLQNQLEMFKPSAMQLSSAMSAGQLGALGDYGTSISSQRMAEDPMAGLKGLAGQGAALNYLDPYMRTQLQRLKNLSYGKTIV